MEIAYVNVKKDRSGVLEQVKGLEEVTRLMKGALKDASSLKSDKRKADELSLQLQQVTQLLAQVTT